MEQIWQLPAAEQRVAERHRVVRVERAGPRRQGSEVLRPLVETAGTGRLARRTMVVGVVGALGVHTEAERTEPTARRTVQVVPAVPTAALMAQRPAETRAELAGPTD